MQIFLIFLFVLRSQRAVNARRHAGSLGVSVCLLALSRSRRHVRACLAALCRADCAVLCCAMLCCAVLCCAVLAVDSGRQHSRTRTKKSPQKQKQKREKVGTSNIVKKEEGSAARNGRRRYSSGGYERT